MLNNEASVNIARLEGLSVQDEQLEGGGGGHTNNHHLLQEGQGGGVGWGAILQAYLHKRGFLWGWSIPRTNAEDNFQHR